MLCTSSNVIRRRSIAFFFIEFENSIIIVLLFFFFAVVESFIAVFQCCFSHCVIVYLLLYSDIMSRIFLIFLLFLHFVQFCHIFGNFFLSSFLLLGWRRAKRLTFSSMLAYVTMASCVPFQFMFQIIKKLLLPTGIFGFRIQFINNNSNYFSLTTILIKECFWA